jgi:hypothetical protein
MKTMLLPTTTSNVPTFDAEQSQDTIFVSIASYRDSECAKTVADVFAKALYPDRIHVGVCQQNEDGDEDCMNSMIAEKFRDHIRVLRLPASEARGPMYARALIEQELYQGEQYFLQIDSHTVFIDGWDAECIRELVACPSDRPVLTYYPDEYDIRKRQVSMNAQRQPVTFLTFRDFHPRFYFVQQDRSRCKTHPRQPLPSLFWAAGFSFTLGEAVREVPYDPNCPYLFLGEEISMAARLYTHGWDLFSPMKHIVFHYTPRHYRPTFWEQFYKRNGTCKVDPETREIRKAMERQSNARLLQLLETGELEQPYGLGTVRTLAQFQEHIGLDFVHRKMISQHARMGVLQNASVQEMKAKWGVGHEYQQAALPKQYGKK